MPFIFCVFQRKKINTKDNKAFFVYSALVVLFLSSVISFKYILHNPHIGLLIGRLFLVVECTLLSLFFYYNLKSSKRAYFLVIGIGLILSLFFYDLLTNTDKPSFLPLATEGFFFIFIILYFFYERVNYITDVPLYSLPSFWISVGLLISFSGTFFLYLVSVTMAQDPSFRNLYNSIYGTFTVIKNVLLCVGIYSIQIDLSKIKELKLIPNLDL
jgi:hypothetical protein